MDNGKNAQTHPDQTAARSPKLFRAMKNTGMHVRAENRQLRDRITRADALVYTPKSLKTPARRYGYTGVSQAVGPVSAKYGLLNPLPSTMERAMRPDSPPKRQWSRAGSRRSG